MTRVALYARYSDDQQSPASIDDQFRICAGLAQRHGWSVVARFSDEALTGASGQRPGFLALQRGMRDGAFDVVLAESLDRLSRDTEHSAALYKLACFQGQKIVTLSEGEVSEIHIVVRGTMASMALKDIAAKTHRGLEGVVLDGRNGGGLCYGYRVIRDRFDAKGNVQRGHREIDPAEAAVVQRIFREFAAGRGPKTIAQGLNRDGIPGPRGGIWSAGTLRGQAARSTGTLRNRLYIGEQVWNQRRWLKHPVTARRVAKANSADAVIRQQIPALRIIDDALWGEVEAMLTRLSTRRPEAPEGGTNRFWEQRRAQHLLTGKLQCGCCGATLTAVGRDYLACRTAQAAGPCENRGSVRRQTVEGRVLEALGSEMMQPALVAEFVSSFMAEWNRQQAASRGTLETRRRKLHLLERKYDGLVEAIADGMRTAGLRDKLLGLEAEIAGLKSEIDEADQGPAMPGLHGNLADVYRQEVAALREALSADDSPRTLEALRALIDRVDVYPGARRGEPRLELVGKLSAMLELAVGQQQQGPARLGVGPDMVLGSVKGDAGTGFEPVTFRL